MQGELEELIETAIYKEIESQAVYIAGQRNTQDAGAITLMKQLAEEELHHSEWLKKLKERGVQGVAWHPAKASSLKISEYLSGVSTLEGASLQDTLIFAMKREQHAIEFYTSMMSLIRTKSAKRLCQKLAAEELRHKLKLEIFYDDVFYGEN